MKKNKINIPERFGLNITKICPLSCSFCFNSKNFLKNGYHHDLEQLKKEIDYLCQYDEIKEIDLTPLVGEPFLHPNIKELINYILMKNKRIYIISSLGVPLSNDILYALKNKQIKIFCSLYGDNFKIFQSITNTDRFNIVISNLKNILKNKINITIIKRFDESFSNPFFKLFKIDNNEITNRPNNLLLNKKEINYKKCYFLSEPILNNGYIYKCCYNYNEDPTFNDRLSISIPLNEIYNEFETNWEKYNNICKKCLWFKDE